MKIEHTILEPSPGQLGVQCSCGKGSPTRKLADRHAAEANLLEKNQADAKVTAQAAVNRASDAIQATQKPAPAEEARVVEPVPTAPPSASAKRDTQSDAIAATDKGVDQVEFADLSPFDQTRLQIKKYATQLVGGEWGNEFMLNLTVIARNEPRIAKCSPESIVKALKACIDCRLMPNTYAQNAMVAPYWNSKNGTFELQFQLMKNGLVELARRSGQVRTINAELVYEGDEFDVELGTERRLHHKPNFDIDRTDASKVTHAYMTAVLENGEHTFEIVTKRELDKIKRNALDGKKGGPWIDWEPEMQKKTAIKRGAKLLPSSPEMQAAIRYDSLEEAGKLGITPGGELVERDPNALSGDIAKKIRFCETVEDLQVVLRSLSVADQKKASGAVTAKVRELAV